MLLHELKPVHIGDDFLIINCDTCEKNGTAIPRHCRATGQMDKSDFQFYTSPCGEINVRECNWGREKWLEAKCPNDPVDSVKFCGAGFLNNGVHSKCRNPIQEKDVFCAACSD